jgi:hypothetical protein
MSTYAPVGSTYGALGGTYANLRPIVQPTWVAFEGEATVTVSTVEGHASLAAGALEGL